MALRPLIPPNLYNSSSGGSGALRQVVVNSIDTIATGSNNPPTWSPELSVELTTTKADSVILVLAFLNLGASTSFAVFARIERGGSPLIQGAPAGNRTPTLIGPLSSNNAAMFAPSCAAYETPGAIGTYQYDVSIATEPTGVWYLNRSQSDADTVERPRGASVIIAMEVAP